MKRLTLVQPTSPRKPDPEFLGALDGIVREAKALRPTTAMVIFELPDGVLQLRSYPDSGALRAGMIRALFEAICIDEEE
jgi:hypothetical protein